MENKTQQQNPQQCGPNCDCKTEKGMSQRTKIILLSVIIICAGAVLAAAIVRKSRQPAPSPSAGYAANAIATQGMRMGVFQLASGTPDFELINSQLPSPGVLVVVKGRGMRGVAGKNITKTNLLQACVAAMQPSSCCPAGGNRVCK